MPYSGDRRLSPPPTLSYLSPSAAPFTVARPRATPDPIPPNAPNPSPPSYPDLPTAPSLYESWVEPPSTYMDRAAAVSPAYRGELTASPVPRARAILLRDLLLLLVLLSPRWR